MSNWIPTMELRVVKRNEVIGSYARILQQKWIAEESWWDGEEYIKDGTHFIEEWRDVPEVNDEKDSST